MNISMCKIFMVILFNLIGIGLLMISQNAWTVVKGQAAKKAILVKGSDASNNFIEAPVNTTIKFYFFNLVNLDAVQTNGTKPKVEQRGPYVFDIVSVKNMTWQEGVVTYEPTKTYFFNEELSKGKLEDVITTVNPVIITMADEYDPSIIPSLFSTATVNQFLFEGIPDETTGLQVGYFSDKNGTIEGTFEAFSGETNITDLNRLITFNGSKSLLCEDLAGTNGERFPPFSQPPATVTLFNPALCRPWNLHYNEFNDVYGLPCARYSAGRDFFSRTLNRTLDACLEKDLKDVGIQGIFNAEHCQELKTPILFSLPHFYNADSDLATHIDGLLPNEKKHNFYLDVYPELGFVLDMRIRVQVNFRLKQTGGGPKTPEIIYPVFWQEMMLSGENRDKAAAIVYSKVITTEKLIFWLSIVLGVLSILIGEIFLVSGMCARSNSDDYQS